MRRLTRHVLTGRAIAPLTPAEHPLPDHSTLLLHGLRARHVDGRPGQRQLVALHLAGDLVDLHAYPMRRLNHDVAALSESEIALERMWNKPFSS